MTQQSKNWTRKLDHSLNWILGGIVLHVIQWIWFGASPDPRTVTLTQLTYYVITNIVWYYGLIRLAAIGIDCIRWVCNRVDGIDDED